jgi:hypothetical protein
MDRLSSIVTCWSERAIQARFRNEMGSAMRSADQQPQTVPSLVANFVDLGRALRSLVDSYRPELHYMRGPGPKWHAQHGPAAAKMGASAVSALVTVNG